MFGRTIRGADGREWRVARRWLPWAPRKRGRFDGAADALHGSDLGVDIGDGPAGVVIAIVAAVAFVLFIVFVLPIVLTILEIVLVLFLLPLFVVARLVLRKPWVIVARTKGPPPEERSASVSGWRASGNAMQELVQEIQVRG